MEMKGKILTMGFLITLVIFLSMLLFGTFLDKERYDALDFQFAEMEKQIADVQHLMILSETYGDQMACVAFSNKLADLDKTIWDLGIKLEQYRVATEEFREDEYYKVQKKLFNEQEVLYLALLTQIKNKCNYSQSIISFFYSNAKDCPKCDDQSFVLSDINLFLGDQISIFSFDTELELSSIDLLKNYYRVDQLPCIIINEQKYCGIKSKGFILDKICENNSATYCKEI